jgi:hypothetical protein
MNATGLRKILKKFDKRFGCKFEVFYVTTWSNHPYSQLQQVFKQVVICWHFTFDNCLFLLLLPQLTSISSTYHALLPIQGIVVHYYVTLHICKMSEEAFYPSKLIHLLY